MCVCVSKSVDFNIYIYIFLGLRPLAGYAFFEVIPCHVMFCMRNVACAMIWLVRLCMLPTLTPDNAGDAGFLGPIRAPTQKADMGSRARARQRTQKKQPKKSSPQARPEPQMQQNTVNSSVLWLGSRARAPKSPKTNAKKARTAQRASQPQQKQNGQNNRPTLSTAVFGGIYSVL